MAGPIDTSVPHPARRYNYLLGGKDNFAADRASADQLTALFPTVRTAAIENRRFLKRSVRFLAGERGIRQFLDIGTGLPTADNTHQVAQRVAPESRVVYVDNDPMVMVHARALLTSTPEGATSYLEDDLRHPEQILRRTELHNTIDIDQPVALMLVAVLHFIHDEDEAVRIVRRLTDALAPGSYVVFSGSTTDFSAPELAEPYKELVRAGKIDIWPRSKAEYENLFSGLEILEPGVVAVSEWRPDGEAEVPPAADVQILGGVARKV
ncbi:SAM-dependent methyltransferase [Virgisporangium ochraceum]|uniref:S-adenosyl methyltransferase n=1 Tax=Virgisporangium ochraceum TaxID=65505 RepID=A0A8J4EEA1_9ACTN|nr:SAM-dependent methyltransferase [Virgisporangium ochraceum]GIJ68817.1 hypothetical protein Voc01_037340 [Virgisporangium ochraceum]